MRWPAGGSPGARWYNFRRTRRPRALLGIAGAVLLLGVGWLWIRDSALVSVNRVTVTGASGPDAAAIRRALTTAARGMTTLDVNRGQLIAALAPYPEVRSLQVSAEPPHGLRIRVIERLAVGQVVFDGRAEAVTASGKLLGPQRTEGLPQITLSVPPGGTHVTDPTARLAIEALGAAPYELLSKISQVKSDPVHGLVAQLKGGPAIYLGDGRRLHAKWLAAAAVLADPGSAGAEYVDVTDPGRPAAGAVSAGGAAATSGSSTASQAAAQDSGATPVSASTG